MATRVDNSFSDAKKAGAGRLNGTVISVTGLGYVGLPVAVEFANRFKVIGFDVNEDRIRELRDGFDRTEEVQSGLLKNSNLMLTSKSEDLRAANFHIVAVPTPVDEAHQPDMSLVFKASQTIGRSLKSGDVVVYESTVYPGATEDECVPILEKESGLKGGVDFKVGFSPERINPGDKEHTFTKIKKIVSGQDEESLNYIDDVYSSVVTAGVHRAESIKVAEAAKVIENAQRDLNIAFMNELSVIFHRLGIDTKSVLKAAGTKWNFLKFTPGLVGGHCIGVDPYYLTHKSEMAGYHPDVLLAGRRINDDMGRFVARETIDMLIKRGGPIKGARVNLLGLTFKENCPDVRNTRVVDIYQELNRLGVEVEIADTSALSDEIYEVFGKKPKGLEEMKPADALILAVPHRELITFVRENLRKLVAPPPIFVDVKGAFGPELLGDDKQARYWRL